MKKILTLALLATVSFGYVLRYDGNKVIGYKFPYDSTSSGGLIANGDTVWTKYYDDSDSFTVLGYTGGIDFMNVSRIITISSQDSFQIVSNIDGYFQIEVITAPDSAYLWIDDTLLTPIKFIDNSQKWNYSKYTADVIWIKPFSSMTFILWNIEQTYRK